jgi:hypothetical protein
MLISADVELIVGSWLAHGGFVAGLAGSGKAESRLIAS